jgi:hypothetical protein
MLRVKRRTLANDSRLAVLGAVRKQPALGHEVEHFTLQAQAIARLDAAGLGRTRRRCGVASRAAGRHRPRPGRRVIELQRGEGVDGIGHGRGRSDQGMR